MDIGMDVCAAEQTAQLGARTARSEARAMPCSELARPDSAPSVAGSLVSRRRDERTSSGPPKKPAAAPSPTARKGWRRIVGRSSAALQSSSPMLCTDSVILWIASASS